MNSRPLAVAAVLLMVIGPIGVGAGGFVGTVQAATLVVDDDGMNCPGAGHTTIQSAVNSASGGDSIEVCAGNYSESVTVDVTNLMFVANGSVVMDGQAALGAAYDVEADGVVVTGFLMRNYTGSVVFTRADGTTISNNRIEYSGPGAKTATKGVYLYGNRDAIVMNNVIVDVPGGPSTRGPGILARGDAKFRGNKFLKNTIIVNNTISAKRNGIDFRSDGSGSVIRNNSIYVDKVTLDGHSGIRLGSVRNVVVMRNDITVRQTGEGRGITGNVRTEGNLLIDNNTVSGARYGIWVSGNSNPDKPVVVQSNDVSNSGNHGVRVKGVAATQVNNNSVRNPGGNGIVLVESVRYAAMRNRVTGTGDDGISVIGVDEVDVGGNIITEAGGRGVVIAESDNIDVSNNRIDNPAGAGMVLHRNGNDLLAGSNQITNGTNGIRLRNAPRALLRDNHIDGSDVGLWFEPGNTFVNGTANVVLNATTGIRIEPSGSPGLTDSRLHDNVVSNASSEAVGWEGTTPNTTVTNLMLDSAVIDFEAADISLQAVETPPDDPLGKGNVGKHIEASSLDESAFLTLTATYPDGAATAVNESTIAVWTYDESSWSVVPGSSVDTDTNQVKANVTSFSTIAPLGTLTDSTTPDVSNVAVDVVDTRTISMSLESNESLAVIEAEIANETGMVVETLTAADFGSVGTDPVVYFAQARLGSAGTYTVTLTNASDQAVNNGASGENATVRLVVEDVSIEHVNGTAPHDLANLTSNVYLSQGPGELLQIQLRDGSAPTGDVVNRTDLETLGVEPDTVLAINVTLVDWAPRLLLGTGHDLSWTTTDVGANVTALNLTVQPAEIQLIESQLFNPDEPWPTGANDRADIRLNATVDLAVDDMNHLVNPGHRDLVDGTILATDAQAFGTPRYDGETNALSLFVAGPHLMVDGENHTGFYDAFLPDALLDEWGVEDASELTVAYQGDPIDFAAQNVDGGIELAIDLTYSAGDVAISRTGPESDTEPEPEPEPAPPSASDPDPEPEPDDESEQTKTVDIDDTGDNVTVRKTIEVANASANTTVSLDVSVEPDDDPENATEEHPVTLDRLNVTMNRTSDVSLTITESPEPPTADSTSFEADDGTALLGYLRIDHELDDADVGEVELEFRVRKDLLDEAGDDPEHVALYRLEGEGWAELPTALTGETDTHYVFRAVSPGLSEFATGAKRAKFEIAHTQVSVTELRTGDDFEVLVRITNVGGADGTYTVELWIEADQIAGQTVTVAANGTRQVTFDHEFETPGSYEVRVNDRSTGQIHVLEVTPTPTEVTPSTQPAGTPVVPDTAPPEEPITIPLPGFGMDVALVALAMATLLAVWRRD